MAALTVTDGVFGAKGTTCPATTYKVVDIARSVDFAVTNVEDNANYALIAIPKGFMITHLAVEQTALFGTASMGWTFKLKSDSTQIGGTFVPAASGSLVRKCTPATYTTGYMSGDSASWSGAFSATAASPKFCSAADTLCVCVPDGLTSEKEAAGAMTVHVIGYQVFGESLGDIASDTPSWAEGQSADDAAANKSGGDPMFRG